MSTFNNAYNYLLWRQNVPKPSVYPAEPPVSADRSDRQIDVTLVSCLVIISLFSQFSFCEIGLCLIRCMLQVVLKLLQWEALLLLKQDCLASS